MGVEVRRVPLGWIHPEDADGNCIPMHDQDYESAASEWIANLQAWERGEHPDRLKAAESGIRFYWDWETPPPDSRRYRPKFDSDPTCYQLYENTTEGTPISEVFTTMEEFVQHLIALGHSEKAVRRFVEKGFAPSIYLCKDGTYLEGIDVWDGGFN